MIGTPANVITAEILVEIPKFYASSLRIWRNNRVDAMVPGRNGKPRRVQAGIDGQADISGIIAPHGKRIEIEVKAGKDRMSDKQIAFKRMIEAHGGIYILAHSLADVVAALEGR